MPATTAAQGRAAEETDGRRRRRRPPRGAARAGRAAMTANPVLDEAYDRLHRCGPEFGGDEEGNHGLTNHGPMAAEVMVRRGLDIDVARWVERYLPRLR